MRCASYLLSQQDDHHQTKQLTEAGARVPQLLQAIFP
jgi:hypothetical protein